MSGRDGDDSGECGGYTGCEGVHLDARRTCTARAQVIARALILLPHDSDKTPGSIGGKTGLSTGGMRLCVTRRLGGVLAQDCNHSPCELIKVADDHPQELSKGQKRSASYAANRH